MAIDGEEGQILTQNEIYERNRALAVETRLFGIVRLVNNNGFKVVVNAAEREVGLENPEGQVAYFNTNWRD